MDRQSILIISPTPPRFDKNSGDLRFYTLLRLLAQDYALTFFCTEVADGDHIYFDKLAEYGIDVCGRGGSFKSLLAWKRFDVAFLEFYYVAEYYSDRIRLMQPECRVIVDSVDVHYLRLLSKYELTGTSDDLARYEATRRREVNVYSRADTVIAVTEDDAAVLRQDCPGLACGVVPNIHDIVLSSLPVRPDSLVFVGGFSHDPNVDAVLYLCNEILPFVREKRPGVTLTIVGSNPPEAVKALAGDSVEVTGYVPETAPYLHRSAISVAPLRFGAGMKGKVGEAMAHGIPVVTTSVGAQGMGLVHRRDVMIADTPVLFAEALLELLGDGELYATVRGNALKLIEENYTAERVVQRLTRVIEGVLQLPPKRLTVLDRILFVGRYVAERFSRKMSAKRSEG